MAGERARERSAIAKPETKTNPTDILTRCAGIDQHCQLLLGQQLLELPGDLHGNLVGFTKNVSGMLAMLRLNSQCCYQRCRRG